ncbi:major royal jelly protein [Cladophialophora carrionii]|uniref:Major royal jelly protein n=1 Tax=Cladophialophora carrionii TaxID=86049 RepID=A0A1C1CMJ9_9EURO|nr:major royal jelly protein [Cladophialophora carrionii]
MKLTTGALAVLTVFGTVTAQQPLRDPIGTGPPLELVHLYFDEWPTGVAVSSSGRIFSCYPLGLDATNTRYQVAELGSNNTETPFPNTQINTPPGGAVDYSKNPPQSKGLSNYFISVQSVVVDPKDRLWVLDTGRALLSNGTLTTSNPGGPKLVGIDLANNSIFQTILFPPNVAFPDSYPNDVRFDLRPSVTSSGQGIAYLTDSSSEGRNGIIVVDLGTGESWRHLNNVPQVRPEPGFYANVWGESVYMNPGNGMPVSRLAFGADGITLSNDGETLYFSVVSGRHLYGVPTARLRDRGLSSELFATGSVMDLGQKGVSDGLESDSNGIVYAGSVETDSIVTFNPQNGTVQTYVRDPRIEWTDTFSVSGNYLYFTENQLFRGPSQQGGVDRRVKPYALYRVPLLNNATKISLG